MDSLHARIVFWEDFADLLRAAGQVGIGSAHQIVHALRPRRRGYRTRRPGPHTPMWNACCSRLRLELRPRGSKVRLARYLGIPKQRITDFITGRRRLPDAEITLQIMYWLIIKRTGKDLSI